MLKSLSIKNIAVIESVSVDFSDGFNILTGETGAGKSIIIDSLNLLKGERAQKNIIRNGELKARVDGIFDISSRQAQELSELLGIDVEEELLVSREITAEGKSSARINGVPVTLAMLKQAGDRLINIHGQHDNTSLLAKKTHIGFLDSFAGEELKECKAEYTELHMEYNKIKKEIDSIDTDEKEAQRRAELLSFQIDEIDGADLSVGEDEELEERKTVLENSYKIASGTAKAYMLLYEGEDMGQSAYDALWTAIKAIEPITNYDKSLEEAYSALNEASDIISENARFLKSYGEDVESTGSELDDIETRLEEISTLKRKYGSTIEDILNKRDAMADELEGINSADERMDFLRSELDRIYRLRVDAASKLSNIRKQGALTLSKSVTESLGELCMPNVRFDVRFGEADFKSDGADDVEFVICTNAGEGLKPLADIASGGELSRVMLAIKGVLADYDAKKLLIFDEVDTGVSGAAAQSIGEKLWRTSRYSQVMCVTHLPQIAAMADAHYLIEKHTDGDRTKTQVRLIDSDERIMEIARTLGGASVTEAAMKNAGELISLADKFKGEK